MSNQNKKRYYIILNADNRRAELYKYINESSFTMESAIKFKERWESKNIDPFTGKSRKAIIVEEVK